jgi:dihydroorotate dehydrogenase
MGINNKGVKYAINNLKSRDKRTIVGANIIKGTITSNEKAPYDYEKTFSQLYDFVDYFVINVSCPNVKDVTSLQNINFLSEIIDRLIILRKYYDDYRPILLKISPDLPKEELDDIIELILASGIDGIVASNTTTSREKLSTDEKIINSIGAGGLSGLPLYEKSLNLVKYINNKTQGQLPIIAVGGILTPFQVKEMLDSGASLVQIYTGFIYNGPSFIKRALKYLVYNKE